MDAPAQTHSPDSPADWDALYCEREQVWSGDPNLAVAVETAGLAPGTALDVGCGEGADAVWLARQGWTVTGLDVSQVALERARAAAAGAGVDVTFLQAGLADAALPAGGFDLVSAAYPALPSRPAGAGVRALLGAVAPGGTLLVVHHDLDPERAHGFDPAAYVGHEDVVAALDGGWRVVTDERRERTVSAGRGAGHTHDLVLRAVRLR
jgi:SAM-dependent methyltransferase